MVICETLTGIAYKSITMLSFIMMTRFLTIPDYEVSSIVWYIAGYLSYHSEVASDKLSLPF